MDRIVIVDYGLGNLLSIKNMIHKVGGVSEISGDPDVIRSAEKIILPGVGHFAAGMGCIEERGLQLVLNEMALERRIPVLGICLGMQLMAGFSEEGDRNGLGWFNARIGRFEIEKIGGLKIPQMGWNEVTIRKEHPVLPNCSEVQRFYFTHSYHLICNNDDDILATSVYGYEFTSAVLKDNIIGVQFHPEKSHRFGMEMMRRFIHWK